LIAHPLLEPVRALHYAIRARVMAACAAGPVVALAEVAADDVGDTQYAIDAIGESPLIAAFSAVATDVGGLVLIAEGLGETPLALPLGASERDCRYRVIVDPIDGTRGLMYQKRPAWVLTGVALNRGAATRLSDIELAVQTELPLLKQHLADELCAVRGEGVRAERVDLLSGERRPLELRPSRARGIEHGFAMLARFFPGARDVLGAIDDELASALLGPAVTGKARAFEDQYLSSGGQLYELMAGHDRFVIDVRPLLKTVLAARGLPPTLACHPYDLCTALIAQELGVCLRDPRGGVFDAPFDVDSDVAWAGYANLELQRRVEPLLLAALARHGLLERDASPAPAAP
jgi:hypothetical protein